MTTRRINKPGRQTQEQRPRYPRPSLPCPPRDCARRHTTCSLGFPPVAQLEGLRAGQSSSGRSKVGFRTPLQHPPRLETDRGLARIVQALGPDFRANEFQKGLKAREYPKGSSAPREKAADVCGKNRLPKSQSRSELFPRSPSTSFPRKATSLGLQGGPSVHPHSRPSTRVWVFFLICHPG